MNFKDIFKQTQTDEQLERVHALADVKDPVRGHADHARRELPTTDQAFHEFDKWCRQNLAGISSKDLPARVRDLLFQVEGIRGTTPTIRQALKEYDALTWQDVWGNRPDAQCDRNRGAMIRSSLSAQLSCARGRVHAIRNLLEQIKNEVRTFEEHHKYQQEIAMASERQSVTIIPPQPKPEPPKQKPYDVRLD